MSTLHERLLVVIGQHGGPLGVGTALRAVVELHAPETVPAGHNLVYTACSICQERDEMAAWPCPTIQAIARELGVDDSA